MCPSLIEIGSKTAEKNSAQTNRQTNRQTDRQTLRKYWSLGREPIHVKRYRNMSTHAGVRTRVDNTLWSQEISAQKNGAELSGHFGNTTEASGQLGSTTEVSWTFITV